MSNNKRDLAVLIPCALPEIAPAVSLTCLVAKPGGIPRSLGGNAGLSIARKTVPMPLFTLPTEDHVAVVARVRVDPARSVLPDIASTLLDRPKYSNDQQLPPTEIGAVSTKAAFVNSLTKLD